MKPIFKGFLKMYLHDNDPERLVGRAEVKGDWITELREQDYEVDPVNSYAVVRA